MNLYETDREFMERFEHFAFEEVVNEKGYPRSLNAIACINKAAE